MSKQSYLAVAVHMNVQHPAILAALLLCFLRNVLVPVRLTFPAQTDNVSDGDELGSLSMLLHSAYMLAMLVMQHPCKERNTTKRRGRC